MDRETKTISLPLSGLSVEIKSYITGRELRDISNSMLAKMQDLKVDADGTTNVIGGVTAERANGYDDAKIHAVVIKFNNHTDGEIVDDKPFSIVDAVLDLRLEDYQMVMSRGKIYGLMRLSESFNGVPVAKLVELGYSRANELARLHKTLPKILPKAIDKVISRNMPVREVKVMVANSLAGEHLDSGRYEIMELSIKSEDYMDVRKALVVAQARTPLETPDGQSADGQHVVEICREYLQDPASEKVLKQLEEAGAFKKRRLQVEE